MAKEAKLALVPTWTGVEIQREYGQIEILKCILSLISNVILGSECCSKS